MSGKNLILGIGSLSFLVVGFQNCSQTRFAGAESTTLSSQSSGVNAVVNGEGGSAAAPVDPRQTDAQEVKCDSTLIGAAIAYDAVSIGAKNYSSYSSVIPSFINTEYISFAGNASLPALAITAREVLEVGSLSTQRLSVNASTIGSVGNLSAQLVHLVAHSVGDPSRMSASLCIAAHSTPVIGNMSGSITYFGRGEGGAKAHINSIGRVSGMLSLYDVDVDELQNLSTRAKLDNVQVKTLKSASGELILINSRIEVIDQASGVIRLRGSSSVGTITQQTSVQVIQE
jgi:hypothetical protein